MKAAFLTILLNFFFVNVSQAKSFCSNYARAIKLLSKIGDSHPFFLGIEEGKRLVDEASSIRKEVKDLGHQHHPIFEGWIRSSLETAKKGLPHGHITKKEYTNFVRVANRMLDEKKASYSRAHLLGGILASFLSERPKPARYQDLSDTDFTLARPGYALKLLEETLEESTKVDLNRLLFEQNTRNLSPDEDTLSFFLGAQTLQQRIHQAAGLFVPTSKHIGLFPLLDTFENMTFPVGISHKEMAYDGGKDSALAFFRHDFMHAIDYVRLSDVDKKSLGKISKILLSTDSDDFDELAELLLYIHVDTSHIESADFKRWKKYISPLEKSAEKLLSFSPSSEFLSSD